MNPHKLFLPPRPQRTQQSLYKAYEIPAFAGEAGEVEKSIKSPCPPHLRVEILRP